MRIFISYAWLDGRTVADYLYGRFNTRAGWSAWMDRDLHADSVFSLTIQHAIDDADAVVVVLSPDVNRREPPPSFVQRELLYATQKEVNKPVFAVKAAPCAVPTIICGVTYVDFFAPDHFPAAFDKLIGFLTAGTPAPVSPRQHEKEYLQTLLGDKKFMRFSKVYAPLTAQARVYLERTGNAPPIDDEDVQAILDEILTAVHPDKGHSPDDHPERLTTQNFAALTDALENFHRVAIIGDPGSGKTTTLRRFAYQFAEAAAHDTPAGEAAPLPLFTPLGGYDGGDFGAFLAKHFGGLPLSAYLPNRVVLLLDGLNETAHTHVTPIQRWLAENRDVRVMLTCRKLDYTERQLDLQRVDVLPLDIRGIRDFMAAYKVMGEKRESLFWALVDADMRALWQIWQEEGRTFDDFWFGEALKSNRVGNRYIGDLKKSHDKARAAAQNGSDYPAMLGLARNPFLLSIIIALFGKHGDIPANRGDLFKDFVEHLIQQRGKPAIEAAHQHWIDENIQKQALQTLAYRMQAENKGTRVPYAWARGVVAEALPAYNPDDLLYLGAAAGIIDKGTEVTFTHQLLGEYFAAEGLRDHIKQGKQAADYWQNGRWWQPTGWEETVTWLLPVHPVLACRALTEGLYDPTRVKPVQAALVAAMLDAENIPPLARAEAGRLLNRLGDPRKGVGVRPDGLPDIDWVPIPAGDFLYGHNKEPKTIKTTYEIARYPVTNAQFQAFLDDKESGYNDERWWTAAGLDWKKDRRAPGEFADPDFRLPNHPRIYVTWYEALAFCRWLGAKMGIEIRLPTEEEWERAARGTQGLIYPYGDTFDATKGNTYETGIGQTTAVGIFPSGASPAGVLDMSGNVWEWCLTKYEDGSNDINGTDVRVLRGGSFYSDPQLTRAADRDGDSPDDGFDLGGFRVVCMRSY